MFKLNPLDSPPGPLSTAQGPQVESWSGHRGLGADRTEGTGPALRLGEAVRYSFTKQSKECGPLCREAPELSHSVASLRGRAREVPNTWGLPGSWRLTRAQHERVQLCEGSPGSELDLELGTDWAGAHIAQWGGTPRAGSVMPAYFLYSQVET